MDPARQNPIWLTCKPLQRMCSNRMQHIELHTHHGGLIQLHTHHGGLIELHTRHVWQRYSPQSTAGSHGYIHVTSGSDTVHSRRPAHTATYTSRRLSSLTVCRTLATLSSLNTTQVLQFSSERSHWTQRLKEWNLGFVLGKSSDNSK